MKLLNRISSAFDAMAYAISPEWGARRMAVRKIFEASTERANSFKARALESAETDRLREGKWIGSRLSTDSWMEEDLDGTRQRSRELYRNDFIGGAVDSRVEHTIGTGFTVQAKISEWEGVVTAKEAEQFNDELELLYSRIEPIACRSRKRSLWQKMSLIARNIDVDGEALAVFSDIGTADAPIPLVVEVIDVDRLETPSDRLSDPLVRMGIEYDKQKRIVAYHIRKNHPEDSKEHGTEYDRVDASRVCHIFVEWFAGQSRGLPWMTRALNRAKDGKDLTEASIIAAQVEACYAVFIKSKSNPIRKAIGAATGTDTNGERIEDIRPGRAHYIGADEEVAFAQPTKSNSVGTLTEYNNRTIAAALNWAYEMLMKDWRGVSFAGGRIILHGCKISVRCRQKLIGEGFCRPYWHRMVDEAVILGEAAGVSIDPRLYRDYKHIFRQHSWTPPRFAYAITPGEEVKAKVEAIDNNLATLADTLAEDQLDLEEVIPQRAKERAMERDNDIVPTRYQVAQQQTPQPEPDEEEGDPPQDKEQEQEQEQEQEVAA